MRVLSRTATGLALALAIAATSAALASAPHARAARACNLVGKYGRLGPSYVETLDVRGVSCSTGQRVVSGYYRCRLRSGGLAGRCRGRVFGFRCHERRSGIPTQFDAIATCTRGAARVVHRYTQNV